MTAKKPSTSRRTFVKGTAASAAIAPFFIGRSAKASEPEFTFKFASVAPKDTPWDKLAKKAAGFLEKKSDGRIKVKRYLGGALGPEKQTAEACKAGRIHGVGVSMGGLFVPELAATELPYMFSSSKQAEKALDANRELIHDILWDNGFKLLMFAENGPLGIGTKGFPVATPADLKGRKIRTQEAEHHRNTTKAMGASPVPMGITEVLPSLQTGVIEGYTNTPLFAFAAGLAGSTTHWAQLNHINQSAVLVLSAKIWETLPSDLQEALTADVDELRKIERRGFSGVRSLAGPLKDNFVNMGIEYSEPDPGPWRKATAGVHDQFRKTASKQGLALLEGLKKAK